MQSIKSVADEMKKKEDKEQRKKQGKKIQKVKQALAKIKKSIIVMFADENEDTWAQYVDGDNKQFYQIMSQPFEDFVRTQLNEMTGEPREQWIQPIMKLLDSQARRKEHRKLYIRNAEFNGDWYVQLNRQQAARISVGNLGIIDTPLIFRNFPHQLDRPVDLTAKAEDIHLLRKYVPKFSAEQEYMTWVCGLPVYLIPKVSKPISQGKGEPGSGKSTLCRIEQSIIDPSSSMNDGIEFPKDDKDWYALAREHSHIFIDNVGRLTPDQQDKLCRVITGTSVKKRKLYTDFTTVQAQIKLSVSLNAIDLTDLQSDYLDRTLSWELDRISDERRKSEEQLKIEFKKDYPKIMGAILQILAKARQVVEKVTVPKHLRLSDFARYATACACVLDYQADEYLKLLELKAQQQRDDTILQSRIAEPLFKFMEDRDDNYIGTSRELLKELTGQEFGRILTTEDGVESIELPKVLPRYWPSDPAKFSKEIRRIGFVLRAMGVKVTFKPREGNRRPLELSKIIESFGKSSVIPVISTPFIDDDSTSMTDQKELSRPVTNNDRMTGNDRQQKRPVIKDSSSKTKQPMTDMTVDSKIKDFKPLEVEEEQVE